MSGNSQSSGETLGHACFLAIFIPLLIVAAILQFLFRSIGGWLGLLAATLVAGCIYLLWLNATRDAPVLTAQDANPEEDGESEAGEKRDA